MMDITKEVQSALPELLAKMRDNIIDRAAKEAEAVAIQEVRLAAKEWALAVLVPEMKAQLEAGKDGFIKSAQEAAKSLGDELGKALQANAAKSLQSSHIVRDIAEKLFRGY